MLLGTDLDDDLASDYLGDASISEAATAAASVERVLSSKENTQASQLEQEVKVWLWHFLTRLPRYTARVFVIGDGVGVHVSRSHWRGICQRWEGRREA